MAGTTTVCYSNLGKSGLRVSNICLGTATFGTGKARLESSPSQCDENQAHAILDRFLECGGNFIDTSNSYGLGKAETIVGNWLKKQNREKLVIATKVRFGKHNVENPNGLGSLSRVHIIRAVEESLQRLQTSYIDLYQIHTWDDSVPIEETLRTLNDLVKAGKVHYLGACNMTGWQMQKIVEISKYNNWVPWISLQQQYSLFVRESEFELMDVCKNEGIGILPWGALKGGWLSGKFKRGMTVSDIPQDSRVAFAQRTGHTNTSVPTWDKFANDDKMWGILDLLEHYSKDHNKTVAQVALRWLLQKETVSSVVIGVTNIQQLEDNLGSSGGWEFTEEQMENLDKASAYDAIYPYDFRFKADGQA